MVAADTVMPDRFWRYLYRIAVDESAVGHGA